MRDLVFLMCLMADKSQFRTFGCAHDGSPSRAALQINIRSQVSLVAKLSLIHLLLVPFLDFFRSQQSLHNPLYGYQSLQPVSGRKNQLTTICLVCSITLFDSKHGLLSSKFIICMEMVKLVIHFFSKKVQKALVIAKNGGN